MPPVDRAQRRKARRANKDHGPLLQLVAEENARRSVRPTEKELKPLNAAQAEYLSAIGANIVTFGVGPAGTGKTWLAAHLAARAFKAGETERIIITRPAVEAGESLGYLPGELEEKYEVYFRPVKDALIECLGAGPLEYAMKAGQIEARPLGFIRGATFKDAWVIADEMQNATAAQFKLLLTRIGEPCKIVLNGDPDQADIANSGLLDALRRLAGVPGIATVRFTEDDVVRSGIVRDILRAYGRNDSAPLGGRYTDDDAGLRRMLGAA